MQVKLLTPDKQKAWDGFVTNHPKGTFFHLSAWQDVIETAFNQKTHYLYLETDGAIEGILPLTFVDSPFFTKALISNAFCVYGGPLVREQKAADLLDQEAIRLMDSLGARYLEYRQKEKTHINWACNDSLYATFERSILPDEEENLLLIPRKQRAVVRKALDGRVNLNFVWQDNVDQFFKIYSQSVRDLGTPVFPKTYFQALKKVFQENCQICTVYSEEGEALTALVSFYFKESVLPYYGGGTKAARKYGAYDYMYWKIMDDARIKGLKLFDFGRSKVGTGAYDYKCNWGFEPKPLAYEYHLAAGQELPNMNPLNPKYRLFIEGWKRLPLCVANHLGPMIVRQIG